MAVRRTFARWLTITSTVALLAGLLVPGAAQAVHAFNRVAVGDFFFEPDTLTVRQGETVTWRFVGAEPHTATADDGTFDSGVRVEDQTFTFTFNQAGTFPYFCKIHPFMRGVVEVGATEPTRLTATDTVGAALAWSRFGFPDDGASTALLARSDLYPDSLASGPVQGLRNAPLLLTPSGSLAASVRTELQRLKVSRVTILGGPAAVSTAVEGQLKRAGYTVSRVFGADRIATATAVAGRFFPDAERALVARAFGDRADPTRGFADALGAGAVGAATGQPVLLSHTQGLSAATREYLRRSAIRSVTVVGGEAALSPKVEQDLKRLGLEVERAAGPNRFDTALALTELLEEHIIRRTLLVDGTNPNSWASGFAAAAHAEGARLLLTAGDELPGSTTRELMESRPAVTCAPFVTERACDRAGIAASSEEFPSEGTLAAVMTGQQEVPPGDPQAFGAFDLRRTSDPGAICYSYFHSLQEPPTAAHIHRGGPGEAGPAVLPLSTEPMLFGDVFACAFGVDPALVSDILANPKSYYANVHTATFPQGAIRGQLFDPSFTLIAFMSGDQEVPPGDPEGFGFAFMLGDEGDPDRLCYFYGAFIAEPATAAHIHRGPPGQSGPAVVPLKTPPSPETPFVLDCVDALDPALVADIGANPQNFYANVHTEKFPQGAIRGQLLPFGDEQAQAQAASRGQADRQPRASSFVGLRRSTLRQR